MNFISLPCVSIVVIGHNEGKNLEQCFKAIGELNYPTDKIEVIYVDSKSKDNSVEIAKKYTAKIFLEKSYWPTAGEAFNRGIIESSHDFIHITAGDIQLHTDYLLTAVQTLLNRDDIHAVTGYFVEKRNKGWNKLLAYRREEDLVRNDHFVETPNGGTFKKEALIKINGYDERIKKGQETELGQRFNKAGFKILYLHIQQGIHDFELNSFTDMVQRYIQNGVSFGHLFLLSLFEKDNEFAKRYRKNVIKRVLFYLILIALTLVFIIIRKSFISLYILLFFMIYIPVYVLIKQRVKTKNHKIYFIVNTLFSFFVFIGIIKFFFTYYYLRMKGIYLIKSKQGLNLKKKVTEKSYGGQ